MNDVIVSGLKIKPRSYATAVAGPAANGGEPSEQEATSVERQVADFFSSVGIEVDCNNIEACHMLPRKDKEKSAPPAIIMRFTNRKNKVALLKERKKLYDTDVFLSEHLTKRNAEIAKKARSMKKQGKIQATWTANCKIFIKQNGSTPEEQKVLCIRNKEDLDKI